MASLMDDLTQVLENETVAYKKLTELSEELKEALIASDVPSVEHLTAAQEDVSNGIQSLEHRRARIMNDIAVVLNKKPEELKVSALEESLSGQPELQEKLATIRMELKQTMEELKRVNHTNQTLLRQSMELLEFDLNLFRSMRQAPETANYNRSAVNTGDLLTSRGFDAKQ
ncbi:MAG: flagellar protein FlgN [Lachnospiraceae bacterium]|nr:flagellar protein FlgN [bacterium]MDY5516635.1 flagellar protein FlgN [Lachnospiraceae bacterium]